jgi:hypothetical protein
MRFFSDLVGAVAIGGVAMLSSISVSATPVTYLFDGDLSNGTGAFTFDIGAALGTYDATGVSGGPGNAFGLWSVARFTAEVGTSPVLRITDVNGFTSGYSSPAIGGGNILGGSTAIAEWNHMIGIYSQLGVVTQQTTSVPEGGSLSAITGLVLLGMGIRERTQRRLQQPSN